MKRLLFNLVAALSLLLCVAVVVLWVRSRHVQDDYNAGVTSYTSRHGDLIILHFYAYPPGSDTVGTGYTAVPVQQGNRAWAILDELQTDRYGFGGLAVATLQSPPLKAWKFTISYWLLNRSARV